MNEKAILNEGVGSPGDTARAITKKFLELKEKYRDENSSIFKKILNERAQIYKSMGFSILDESLINKILTESNGNLPFVILADIYATNIMQGANHSRAMLQYLNTIIEVVLENYNNLVSFSDKFDDFTDIQIRILDFIGTESRVFGINDSNKDNHLLLDSLYVFQQVEYASCLKFFRDGVVISASVKGDIINSKSTQNDINEWFDISYFDCRGYYKIANNKITFSTFSENGEVTYTGDITSESLNLTFYCKNNRFSDKEIYLKT